MNNEPRDPGMEPADAALLQLYARTRTDEPPTAVDAAILARARAAVAPRRAPRRWWIPASVAATALLALSLVVQISRETRPPTGPSLDEARQAPVEEAATITSPPPSPATASDEPAQAPGPAGSARSAPDDKIVGEAVPTAPAVREAREFSQSVAPKLPAMRAAPAAASVEDDAADSAVASPEEWLARIEALEAEGHEAEAARERAALEAAYPGWIARQSPTPR